MIFALHDSHTQLKADLMETDKTPVGALQMVKINGSTVRALREQKGLTQLYVSAVVGVTTDTISRWENRRYPTIKKENGLKLAEALEVELEEILDHTESDTEPSDEEQPVGGNADQEAQLPPVTEHPLASKRPGFLLVGLMATTIFIIMFSWWNSQNKIAEDIYVARSLPSHVPPGVPFPVVIDITTSYTKPFSFILKETLPPGCTPTEGLPQFISQAPGSNDIKWISKMQGDHAVFSYLAMADSSLSPGSTLSFAGGLTVRKESSVMNPVGGESSIRIDRFHWADENSDGKIDDDEILTVYDTFGALDGLDFNRKLIEEIWSGKGYTWNSTTNSYEIIF